MIKAVPSHIINVCYVGYIYYDTVKGRIDRGFGCENRKGINITKIK